MAIPCKLPILKNVSYLSGIMFTFSIFIPLLSETSSTVNSVNFKVSIIGAEKSLVSDSNLKFNNYNITPTDGTLVLSPFSMTYDLATTSTVSFNAYIEIITPKDASNTPITVYLQGDKVRKSYPQKIKGNTYVYDFGFVEKVRDGNVVLIKFGAGTQEGFAAPKIGPGSSFSGIRMF